MTKKYDVIVVGAGPAGLMVAKTASGSGLNIALLERKTDISKVRRTDGSTIGINEYLFWEVVKFNRKTQTFIFPVSGFSLGYDGPWNDNMYGFHIYSPGGKRFMIGDWKELSKDPEKNSVGVRISKGRLLQGILDDARANGVEFLPGTNVTDIKHTETGAVVTANGDEYEGRYIVAADGINSRIVELIGLNKDRKFAETMRDQTWLMEGVEISESAGMIFVLTMYGRFYILPLAEKGRFHVGTSTHDPDMDLEAKLQRFTREDPVYSSWFKNAKRLEGGESCVVNLWQVLEKPYKDNVIMVGDAFWSQEFSITASLCAGHKLGHILTKAFHDKTFGEEGLVPYLDWYASNCIEPRGKRDVGVGGNLWDYLNAEELDYMAALPEKPVPHTLSFARLFGRIGGTYKELFPKIFEERPDIMEKLQKMLEDKEDIKSRVEKMGFPNR